MGDDCQCPHVFEYYRSGLGRQSYKCARQSSSRRRAQSRPALCLLRFPHVVLNRLCHSYSGEHARTEDRGILISKSAIVSCPDRDRPCGDDCIVDLRAQSPVSRERSRAGRVPRKRPGQPLEYCRKSRQSRRAPRCNLVSRWTSVLPTTSRHFWRYEACCGNVLCLNEALHRRHELAQVYAKRGNAEDDKEDLCGVELPHLRSSNLPEYARQFLYRGCKASPPQRQSSVYLLIITGFLS